MKIVPIARKHIDGIEKILGYRAEDILRKESANGAFDIHENENGFFVSRVDTGWDEKLVYTILFMVAFAPKTIGEGFHNVALEYAKNDARKLRCSSVQSVPHRACIARGMMRAGFEESAREMTFNLESENV